MNLNADQLAEVVTELKQFATDLNLSDQQKEKLKTILTENREKLEQFRQQNPNVSKEELVKKIAANRSSIRDRVVSFLTADQLTKWDAAMAKAKDTLGKMAASA